MLESPFPLHSMRFYASAMILKGHQMGNFVHQGNQKSVFVEGSINRDLMQSVWHSAIITMSRNAMIDDFKMHTIGFDKLKTGFNRSFWKIFLKGGVHIRQTKIGFCQLLLLFPCSNI